MSGDHILSIDCGTQSVRALIFDLRGRLIHKVRIPIEPYFAERPGWAEQHPATYWENLCSACQQVWQGSPVPAEAVAAVSLTTQRGTIVNVDERGEPLRPAILWLDQRRTEGLKPVGGVWGLAFLLSGMRETAAYLQAETEVNWIRTHQPEVWRSTHKVLFLSGYLTHKLVGGFVDSVGCQVGYVPFDYKRLAWSRKWDWKWQAAPMEKRLLPDLIAPTGSLGEITPQAAAETGIPAGLPLIAAAADKACEVIGTGCLQPDQACISYGTTATINTTSRRYVEIIPLIPPYPSAIPGAYNLEISVYRGYWMVRWFRQEFGQREEQLASERGCAPEELFDELIEAVPPGSMGLTLQPYWSPGLRLPGPEAKGAIIGFGDVHTRAHIYRAILEGVAHALREGLERTGKRLGTHASEVRVCGGGSQSDAALQITADVFNLPASRPHVHEASGLGAAITAAVGMGLHADFETALAEMTRISRTFEPDPAACAVYQELHRRVYRRMYRRLRPLYEAIRRATGYPPTT